MNPLMVSERLRLSAALLLTKNKGRDPEGRRKVDMCRFGGIVEPAGNGKGFLYGSVPLFVLFHMMKPIEQ